MKEFFPWESIDTKVRLIPGSFSNLEVGVKVEVIQRIIRVSQTEAG